MRLITKNELRKVFSEAKHRNLTIYHMNPTYYPGTYQPLVYDALSIKRFGVKRELVQFYQEGKLYVEEKTIEKPAKKTNQKTML